MPSDKQASDCVIVIFGASGDLTKRKLIPALYQMARKGEAPEHFAVLGISRTKYSDEGFRDELYRFGQGQYDDDAWSDFAKHVHYLPADSTKAEHWDKIQGKLDELAEQHQAGPNRLFYLSMAPNLFEPVINQLGRRSLGDFHEHHHLQHEGWRRIVVEKPFGYDPDSARHLNNVLGSVFDEQSIYRIDHYLGKELVQNLLVLRFANSIFEPLWNNNYLDHVQITASETVGVEGRGGYYDGPAGGAMRDMIQSHLLQVLALTAMEPPVSMEATDIRAEKIKIFKALRVPMYDQVPRIAVRGQYGEGKVNGDKLPAYREEKDTDPRSQTDTFAAVKLLVDTWRWGQVPFYLRSGKAMAQKKTEIVLYFKPTPHCLFREEACALLKPNQIVINVQPDEGIRLRFEGKQPGLGLNIKDVVMNFDYVEQWKVEPPDAYQTLLHDCLRGDQTLFKHRDEIEIAWEAVQPILDYWEAHPRDDLPDYAAGTWGPPAADAMMKKEGRYWRND